MAGISKMQPGPMHKDNTWDIIKAALESNDWTEDEKEVIKWQFRLNGDFKKTLWNCICRADEGNLDRLALGFPLQVQGYRKWTRGGLAGRMRNAGIPV